MKYNKNRKASKQNLEILEDRRLFSSVLMNGGAMELRGDANQDNSFVVRAASANRVFGFANNFGEASTGVNEVVIYLGNQSDTVTVAKGVTAPVEVIDAAGHIMTLHGGDSRVFKWNGNGNGNGDGAGNDPNSGNSGSGSSNSGSGSSNSHSGSSGSNAGNSNSGSGSSKSGTGSSGSHSNSSGSSSGSSNSSSGSSNSGSSNSHSGSSSSNSGSSNSGSSSSNSGSSASNSGSSASNSGSSTSNSGSSASSPGASGSDPGAGAPTAPTPPPSAPGSSTPVAKITNTTPSGVIYPYETVNVNAMSSSFGSGTSLNSTIAWNFGDSSSAYNTLDGFSAAHEYTSAGTYTITLTITTPDGHVGVTTTTVTIAADNRPTIYVSANGSDSNNGLSANSPIKTINHLNQIISSNERVLFQDGGTYDMTNEGIQLNGLQHVYVGSYGSGAAPIMMYTGLPGNFTMVFMSASTQSVVVNGLTFNSIYPDNEDTLGLPAGFAPEGSGISILNNTFLNLTDDIEMNQVPSNVLVQGNVSPDPTALNAYFCWTQGYNIAIVGNTVANSVGESIIRVGGETANQNIEIADNTLANIADAGGDTRDIAKACIAVQGGSDIYIYNNKFNTGVAGEGPLGTLTGANLNATVSYVVFDSNVLTNGSTFVINPGSVNTMFKNNVVIGTGTTYAFGVNATEINNEFNLVTSNLFIEHNTVTEPGQDGGFIYIFNGEPSGIVMDYNVFVDPNLQVGGGQGYLNDNNDDNLSCFTQIEGNVWGTPGGIDGWTNGGLFFDSSNPNSQVGWLTPAEWNAQPMVHGDVFENVDLGATYSVTADGFTAGSDLPTAA